MLKVKIKKLGEFKNCEICSKNFYVSPSRLLKNKHHTCSKQCLGKLNSTLYSKKILTKCFICQKEISLKSSHFLGENKHCCSRKCSSERNKEKYKGENNPKCLKLNKIERFFWDRAKNIRSKCTRENIDCDIDYKYLLELYNNQEGLCFYSKIPIQAEKTVKDYNTLSVDRIKPELGYIKGNIVLCLLCINMLKSNFDLKKLKNVFNAITLTNKVIVNTKIKLNNKELLPFKKHEDDAGYDLFVSEITDKNHYIEIKTGVYIQPEGNFYFQIYDRSSNFKKGIYLTNSVGIIDKNYTGEIILNFYKSSNFKLENIKIGDRVAQMIPQQQIYVEFTEVEELEETQRNTGGFGSSGL